MIITPKQRFSVTGDLLYPAALGAGIAWWVEALVHAKAHHGLTSSTKWVLLFGAFFLLYHSRSFVIMRETESAREKRANEANTSNTSNRADGKPTPEYSVSEFTKDLIDCVALILAFVCLRLPDGQLQTADRLGVFVVAALIPAGAIITEADWKPRLWNSSLRLRAFALAVTGVGAVLHLADLEAFLLSELDWWLLITLLVMLVLYLAAPHWYGARTPHDRMVASEGDSSPRFQPIRVILASIMLLFTAYVAWRGIAAGLPG
jgi:hypothetical protein